jgi:hypothetical protein
MDYHLGDEKLTPEEMEKKILELEQTNSGILSLLRKIMDPEGKITVNMTIQELIIRITGKSNETLEISTSNNEGKILFVAVKDIDRNSIFAFGVIGKKLDERGWHIPNATLSVALSRMSKGLLIKENGGYRLPSKVTYIGEALNAE